MPLQIHHPGDAEAAAAIREMRLTYGRPLPEPGDAVTGTAGGRRFAGVVLASEPGRLHIEIDGAWIVCSPNDID
jgi:hypothetical protein